MLTVRLMLAVLAALGAAGCDPGRPVAPAPPATAALAAAGSSPTTLAAAPAAEGTTVTQQAPSGAERTPPQDIPPVLHKGVRYEQDMAGNQPKGSAPGGTLAAYDAASGRRLWLLQVYNVHDDPGAPMAHPGRHFRSMVLVPGRDELEIENEAGGRYRVDLVQRSVQQVGGPPETAAPTAPPKPKPKPTP